MAGVGSMFASMVISGFVLGYLTDWWLDTMPLFFLLFGLLGLIGGGIRVHELLTHPELNKLEQRDERRPQ